MRNLIPSNPISRVRYQLRRHGARATIGMAAQHTRKLMYNDNTHVWYELSLGTDRPRLALPPGPTLIRGGAGDLPLLDELQNVSQVEAKLRMEAGDELWLVLEDRWPAFACWIFHNSLSMPIGWAGRQVALPPEIVCLEDSVTSASYRGRGMIGPPAWSQIADRLEQTGAKSIITKIPKDNKVMRWAVVKSGFHELATMHFRRVGFRQRTTVVGNGTPTADWLAEQLQR